MKDVLLIDEMRRLRVVRDLFVIRFGWFLLNRFIVYGRDLEIE